MKLNYLISVFYGFLILLIFSCNSSTQKKKEELKPAEWQLGILAYTFKDYSFFEAVDKAKELGISEIGIFPGQEIGAGISGKMDYHMDTSTQEKVKEYLKTKDVKLADIGVISPDSEEEWDKLFQFAKAMNISTIVSEPDPKLIDYVSTLCDKYQVKVAIHNHASPSIYWNPDTVMKRLEDKSPLMGVCADVGHWYRSGLNPLESLKKVESKLFELHFKDISTDSKEGKDVIWGEGNLGVQQLPEELRANNFSGVLAVEYEGDLKKTLQL